MERTRLELLFDQELLQNAEQARILCGSPVTRFVRSVQTTGGVSAVRELCRRNRPSDAFDSLAQAGRLDLSAEASAVKGKYGPLFPDAEGNPCLTLLLESGYFKISWRSKSTKPWTSEKKAVRSASSRRRKGLVHCPTAKPIWQSSSLVEAIA